jgi:hypothetical protein
MSSNRRPSGPRSADIELVASTEADEVGFNEPPETELRFFGEPRSARSAAAVRLA